MQAAKYRGQSLGSLSTIDQDCTSGSIMTRGTATGRKPEGISAETVQIAARNNTVSKSNICFIRCFMYEIKQCTQADTASFMSQGEPPNPACPMTCCDMQSLLGRGRAVKSLAMSQAARNLTCTYRKLLYNMY